VSHALNERDFTKAVALRDPEFREYLEAFSVTADFELQKLKPPNMASYFIILPQIVCLLLVYRE
jgi:hypothetical protein